MGSRSLRQSLQRREDREVFRPRLDRAAVCFLFPGQGIGGLGAARALYREEAVFRREIDRVAAVLAAGLDLDLLAPLRRELPEAGEAHGDRLEDTALAQPLLFAVEQALACLWRSEGVQPGAVIGHSLGELVAATVAGVMTVEEGALLVARRGVLMRRLPRGRMLSVGLPARDLEELLPAGVELTAVNAPRRCTVAGAGPTVEGLAAALRERGIPFRELPVAHAFHTAAVEPILEPLVRELRRVALRPPEIPLVSTSTGRWLSPEEATDPAFWAGQTRATVRYSDGLRELLCAGVETFVEVGPGRTLSNLVRQQGGDSAGATALATLPSPEDPGSARSDLRRALAELRFLGAGAAEPAADGEPRAIDRPPPGELEARLAAVWEEVLAAGPVEPADDLFQLGGDSLAASQILARVRDALGVEVPLARFLAAPTLRGLAAAVGEGAPPAAADDGSSGPAAERALEDGQSGGTLSFGQERLWLLEQLPGEVAAYNIPIVYRLRGGLDLCALAAALSEVVRRHEVLRTTYAVVEGAPVARVGLPGRQPLPVADLSALSPGARRREAGRWARREGRRRFDLARDRMVRSSLLRLGPDDHQLLLTIHHIAADGGSKGVLARELGALYGAFAAGASSPLPEPPLQYTAFARRQRRRVADELEGQAAYWRGAVGDARVLDLPTDRPRPSRPTRKGARSPVAIPARVAGPIRSLGREAGATPFVTLLATLCLLLERWSGQRDLVVGSPVAGRDRLELESLIGCFVNMLPLRLRCRPEDGFRDLVRELRTTVLGALAHREMPFERLVSDLRFERGTARNPLFEIAFSVEGAPLPAPELPGLAASASEVDPGTSKFDLYLLLRDREGGWAGFLEYATDLFDPTTAGRMAAQLEALAEAAAAEPDRPVGELRALPPAERHHLLFELAAGGAAPAERPAVPALVERQARTLPDAVALVAGVRHVTYGELGRRAGALARRLRARGVGPEVLVAVHAGRTPEMITALLAVLWAGGAYLPLDPDHPSERLAWLLQDSGARLRIAEESLGAQLAEHPRVATLRVGDRPPATTAGGALELRTDPGHLAYVTYTSGSTGRPKGVAVSQGALANLVAWHRRTYGPLEGERVTQLASLGFDASVWEIWSALAGGATLHLIEEGLRTDPAGVLGAWVRERITVSFLPTPLAELLLAEARPPDLGLRTLLTGGDRLHGAAVPAAVPFALVNHYGPTENAVVATAGPVTSGPAEPSIGRPISGVRVHVMDRALRLPPRGAPGELCLGGPSLARGYLGRPALTAEAFVPDPFGGAGERLYRTGDRVRWMADGGLAFLGRLDHQVKVRGVRIEPGEIEAVLARHPGVEEAVVVAREGRTGERQLVAYVTGGDAAAPAASDLRSFLRRRLPEPMVPASFVALREIPLTPHGKVDREVLPAPESAVEEPVVFAPPRGAVEEWLAELWRGLLGVERVGAEDGFFDLGGHSLLAARVAARIRDAFGVELGLAALFEAATLRELAQVVAAARSGGAATAAGAGRSEAAPPDEPESREGVSFAQERLWVLERLHPGTALYSIARAFELTGAVSLPGLAGAFRAIVERHQVLRTVYHEEAGRVVARLVQPPPVGLPLVDLTGVRPDLVVRQAHRLLDRLAGRPFDLVGRGPTRLCLLRLGVERQALFVGLHHIAADGASLDLLVEELEALYGAALAGEPEPLPPLRIQYAEHAARERRRLASVLDPELERWRSRLAPGPAPLALPADRPWRRDAGVRGGRVPFTLGRETAAKVRSLARRERVTPFVVLLGAFYAALGRWSGAEVVDVAIPVSGRPAGDAERLIGFFVNTLVVRGDLRGGPAFRELVARVREVVLDALCHQELPFEKLVEAFGGRREGDRNPLVAVMLAFRDKEEPRLRLSGVAARPLEVFAPVSKLDLTLDLAAGPDGIAGYLEYRSSLFDRDRVERWVRELRALLERALRDPEAPVRELSLLSASERWQMVGEWSRGPLLRRPARRVDEELLEVARRTPDRVAVRAAEGADWTYGELAARAERLARRLGALGVGPERPVGLFLRPSAAGIAAILATWRAGGVHLPLDPDLPPERLRYLLDDARPVVVVTEAALAGTLPASSSRLLSIDGEAPAAMPRTDLPEAAAPEALAYLVYTSGSTGEPKGVAVAHGPLAAHLAAVVDTFRLSAGDRVAQLANWSFDVSLEQVFAPLLAGATVVLGGSAEPADIGLFDRLERAGATVADLPTRYWHALSRHGARRPRDGRGESLRLVTVGGEEMRSGSVRLWREAWTSPPELVNAYGPTEAVITAVAGPVAASEAGEGSEATVPLGRPLAHSTALVLDRDLRPTPLGSAGELCLGGERLARGYLRRPGLTAARFVPDPFAERPGERLHRTGDLVRFRRDGRLEFVGRRDRQVKVRGFRVELGEVESWLRRHPAVRDCAVVASEGSDGERELIAYSVLERGPGCPQAELREFLRGVLPHYQVPCRFVAVDELPRTPSGKVDPRRLPPPGAEAPAAEGAPAAPGDPLERVLVALWQEVLGSGPVGIDQDFFALGGHSLKALELSSKLAQVFGVELPLATLFERPTVSGLAPALRATAGGSGRVERATALFLELEALSEAELDETLARRSSAGELAGRVER